MKKQLLALLLTVGCIPAVLEEIKTIAQQGDETNQTSLVCVKCRRK